MLQNVKTTERGNSKKPKLQNVKSTNVESYKTWKALKCQILTIVRIYGKILGPLPLGCVCIKMSSRRKNSKKDAAAKMIIAKTKNCSAK